jgi:cytoskeletal protein RodZ
MKRCPQCEFIYEDDQSLCDMDGVLLVFDDRNLPNVHALAPVSKARGKAQPKRNRAVPAFATLILALVLGMVYYVSIHRRTAQNTYTPSAAAATTPEPAAPVVNPTPEPSQEVQALAPEEPKPAPAKQPESKPVKKQSVKTASITQTKTEPKKEDSKVGSILKKTGRILKKPFKF